MNSEKILEFFTQHKAQMLERAEKGIEENRKGFGTIIIKDSKGNPVKNADVSIEQKSHEFNFGANLFMLGELETGEKNARYKELFKECFNMATIPFYWDTLEPTKGSPRYEKNSPKVYRRPAPDLCMEFCAENGIRPREHALAYEHFFPEWLKNADIPTIKKEYERRCAEISERYADKIENIEVTNEILWEEEVTPFFFEPDNTEWYFKTTKKFFPNNVLSINEATWVWDTFPKYTDRYYLLTENTLLKGAQIDAIGFQFHMFFKEEEYFEKTRRLYNPLQLYKVLDTYAKLGKDMQITEITIPCYNDSKASEELQATILENLYTIWFSHKNVNQIIYWNLVDGYAHNAVPGDMTAGENYYRGGLLRFDLTPKPAYERIRDLITKKWHTALCAKTDENGKAEFKGFYGEYEVSVNGKTEIINLKKQNANEYIITV